MFGRIGHEDREVTEEDLNKGDVSHVITSLSVDPKNRTEGQGEALIFGTPAGKNLFTYLKAGCKLKTSSRGAGAYKEGVTVGGVPVVDEDNYILETFDFVMRPGFTQTNPQLSESQKQELENMDPTFLKTLEDSRVALQGQLLTAIGDKTKAEAEVLRLATFESRVKKHEKLLKLIEEDGSAPTADQISQLDAVRQSLGLADMAALVDFISKIGTATAEVIQDAGDTPEDTDTNVAEALKQYREIGGTPQDIEKTCARAKNIIDSYRAIGSPKEILETLKQAKEALDKYVEIGGTHEVLKKTIESYKKMESDKKVVETDEAALRLSKKHGLELESTRKILESAKDLKSAEMILENLKPSDPKDKKFQDSDRLPEALGAQSRATTLFRQVMPGTKKQPKAEIVHEKVA